MRRRGTGGGRDRRGPVRRAGLIALSGLGLWCSGLLVPGPVGAAAPQMVVTPTTATPGQVLQVSATGLVPHSLYSLQVCGADAQASTDCALQASSSQAATSAGVFTGTITAVTPPAPCPCVVALFSQPFVRLALTVPLDIPGAPTAAVPNVQPARLIVRGTEVTGSSSPAESFGAPAKRTLLLTVVNAGGTPATSLSLVVNVGSTPQSPPELGGLAPGQQRTYRVPLTFPTLAFGHQDVSGQVAANAQNASLEGSTATFQTSTSVVPWGLVGIAGLLVLLIAFLLVRAVVRMVRRARDRRRCKRAAKSDEPATRARGVGESHDSGGDNGPQAEGGGTLPKESQKTS